MEFNQGDMVYNWKVNTFCKIVDSHFSLLRQKIFYLVKYESNTGRYLNVYADHTHLIKVDPDTPQNRLLIQLKYS
jgi:hypothetical protein